MTNAELAKLLEDAIKTGKVKLPKQGRKPKKAKGRTKPTEAESAAYRAANAAECVKVFTAAGYKDVRPYENVLPYGKEKSDGTKTGWLGKGRRVKPGQKSLKVNGFSLFHVDQTEVLAAPAEVVTV